MPSQGYVTIGLKPTIFERLQKATDEFFPGMFLPSALIIMMNEIKRNDYSMKMHNMDLDFSGRSTSLTLRSDIKQWLEENYNNLNEKYNKKYGSASFTQFASLFLINVFESKADSRNYNINLKESDYVWLKREYKKRKQEYKVKYGVNTFERFSDLFLKDIFTRLNSAKEILTL
ncbi:MAG: hypothetical protein ACREAD_08145 [Nitrosopumilaceae archaeon]